jgi:ElaB/YqjD/DUF883 family membrane-anchored ribosome-binding protein
VGVTQRVERLREQIEDLPDEQLGELLEDLSNRTGERIAEFRRQRIGPAVERVRQNAPEYAEKVAEMSREAYQQAREVAPEYAERVAELSREAYDQAREVAPEYAEKMAEATREAAERFEHYLEERVGEETVETWRPRTLAALAGFVFGVLVGWLLGRRDNDELLPEEHGLAHARRESGPTAVPETEQVATPGDGQQHG